MRNDTLMKSASADGEGFYFEKGAEYPLLSPRGFIGRFLRNVLILALAALLCCLCACGAADSAAEPAEETQPTGLPYDPDAQTLTVSAGDVAALAETIPLLPQLKTVTLEGVVPDVSALLALQGNFPEISLVCNLELDGKSVCTDAQALTLSAGEAEALVKLRPLFFQLRELDVMDAELSDQEKMALCQSMEGVLVRCALPLAGQYFPTDAEQIDISHCPVTVQEVEDMLPFFPKLQKLDMSFCGIGDEEMDALNQRHPQTNIVWTLTIGMAKTRTDAIYFYPAEINYYPTNQEMKKLRYCPELIAIDIGHTRASDCEFLWHTPKVKYLILADTAITDITPVSNLKDLIYLELFNLKLTDYSPLLSCTKLQDLNLGTTHADPAPLTQMTWLHNLQWHRADQNPETREAVLQLPELLPDTNVVLFPKNKARNIGGPWRYIPNYYIFRDIIGATYFNQDQIRDYWGKEDGDRIMACQGGSAAETLAGIVRERIDRGEPIIGIKDVSSEKAEILYETLRSAAP